MLLLDIWQTRCSLNPRYISASHHLNHWVSIQNFFYARLCGREANGPNRTSRNYLKVIIVERHRNAIGNPESWTWILRRGNMLLCNALIEEILLCFWFHPPIVSSHFFQFYRWHGDASSGCWCKRPLSLVPLPVLHPYFEMELQLPASILHCKES